MTACPAFGFTSSCWCGTVELRSCGLFMYLYTYTRMPAIRVLGKVNETRNEVVTKFGLS